METWVVLGLLVSVQGPTAGATTPPRGAPLLMEGVDQPGYSRGAAVGGSCGELGMACAEEGRCRGEGSRHVLGGPSQLHFSDRKDLGTEEPFGT